MKRRPDGLDVQYYVPMLCPSVPIETPTNLAVDQYVRGFRPRHTVWIVQVMFGFIPGIRPFFGENINVIQLCSIDLLTEGWCVHANPNPYVTWRCCSTKTTVPPERAHLKNRRFHFGTHREMDCAEHNSPEHEANPMLWHLWTTTTFTISTFKSSMAETHNAWLPYQVTLSY